MTDVIECHHCHNIKKDEDEKAHRFGTLYEKEWWSIIDTSGYCSNKPCKGAYCNPCTSANFYNPGRKMMFCNPFCYLNYRGGVSGLTEANKNQMFIWCDDYLGYNREQVKLRLTNAFLPVGK
jgi:hypothetical protein